MASAENDQFSNSQASSEDLHSASPTCMQKFRLYETRSMFYMVGRDKSRTYWRVLKIDRLDPSELNIREDSTTYTERECSDLLSRIHEGNKSTGGLNFVTTCYGIVGFTKFLGPYYMLLITKRHQIGIICGHRVYSVSKSELIPLQNSGVKSSIADAKNENRYKRLLCTVDLTKDFFFSYSYHVMHSLQKNLYDNETSHVLYETMFVWNEFLTRGIRTCLQNTSWTVALVYGFFEQASLSVSGRNFKLTLIARRSRHYAGTRYLKRGVNEEGKVANDVETEQIVFEDIPEGVPRQISSVVQYRGSIPLFWSQETSRLNMKPDIIVSNKDQNYEATRLHFQNLVERYENPIIILNLIKPLSTHTLIVRKSVETYTCFARAMKKLQNFPQKIYQTVEKKPRESILRTEFINAIDFINKDCSVEHRLRFLHWDLHKHAQSKATNVLLFLGKVAAYALTLTGFCYYHTPYLGSKCGAYGSFSGSDEDCILPYKRYSDHDEVDASNLGRKLDGGIVTNGNKSLKQPTIQRGVLRTNCIDCLDRTNVAQYAYGLAALGQQLHVLGVVESPKIDLDSPLANDLMGSYERMGDTLAHQYGGSAAHNKIFSERRGQWKAATQSQEFFRTLQRYYSNAYIDSEKQDALNIFLGNFRPQKDAPALWELDASKHTDARRNGQLHLDERSTINRSFSDGNILFESSSPTSSANMRQENYHNLVSPDQSRHNKILSESSPEISTAERDTSFSRCTPTIPCGQLFGEVQRVECNENNHYFSEPGDANFSNFIDLDWLSSSGNSFEEESFDRRALLTSSSITGFSSENVANEIVGEPSPLTSEYGLSIKGGEQTEAELSYGSPPNSNIDEEYSESFVRWVTSGEALCH